MWFRWMMLAFALNGVCTFGMRVMAGRGMADRYAATYLLIWYAAGSLLLGAIALYNRLRARRSDLIIGCALGVARVGGQSSMGVALGYGLPGSVVYPVMLAGGLFLVTGAGIFLFKERVGRYGLIGIALGVVSIILLSI